jgi:cardiolipin synthase A/B
MLEFRVTDNNIDFYGWLLNDINRSQKSVCLETFIYQDDEVGREIRDALTHKAKAGLDVKVLVDSVGAYNLPTIFFEPLAAAGGKIKFFRSFKYLFRFLEKINHRDHQKLFIIDDEITYISSANIMEKSRQWRDLTIRIRNASEGAAFGRIFRENYEIADSYRIDGKLTQQIRTPAFEILRDIPLHRKTPVREKTLQLIERAKKEIYLETPYLIPDRPMRRRLVQARQRGVRVTIVVPYIADYWVVDILNKKYMAKFLAKGMDVRVFTPRFLHSKLLLVDGEYFMMGSSNWDYRSFLIQFELMILGNHPPILHALKGHAAQSVKGSRPYTAHEYQRRSIVEKLMGKLLVPIEKLF